MIHCIFNHVASHLPRYMQDIPDPSAATISRRMAMTASLRDCILLCAAIMKRTCSHWTRDVTGGRTCLPKTAAKTCCSKLIRHCSISSVGSTLEVSCEKWLKNHIPSHIPNTSQYIDILSLTLFSAILDHKKVAFSRSSFPWLMISSNSWS